MKFNREKRVYKGPARIVGLYARVSTQDGRQHLSNQLRDLRAYAARMNWKIAKVYTDKASGAMRERPGLDEMMDAAGRHDFDLVLVFDLSRLTRRGPATAFKYIERLTAAGVEFHSLREEYFRTTGPAGPMLIAIAAYIAEQERAQLQARIRSGIDRAKAAGVTFGRPVRVLDAARIRALRKQGKTIREIAATLKTTRSTIMRRLKK